MSEMTGLHEYRWRRGRKLERTVYAIDHPDFEKHTLVGIMETPALAAHVVILHNDDLESANIAVNPGADSAVPGQQTLF